MRLASPPLAGLLEEPRNACPSTPWSVLMVTRPRSLLPEKRPLWRPYCVAGMSSQAKSVTVMSVIFMGGLPGATIAGISDRGLPPCQWRLPAGALEPAYELIYRDRGMPDAKNPCRRCIVGGAVTMGTFRAFALVLLALGSGYASPQAQAQQKLVIYSSNDDTLHKLVFAAFTKETG